MKILLVEDEVSLASFIRKGIESEGYEIDLAYDGLVGQRMANNNSYDVIVLDVNLPYINGFELCRQIKQESPKQSILLLTALDSLPDKESGFGAGADDYLVKPFEFRELLLRIKALARRNSDYSGLKTVLRVADLELDTEAHAVTRAGQRIDLTAREYALLEYLMINKGKIVSRIDIAEKVWDLHFDTNTNVIEVYINYLRKKIDKDFSPKLVHTIVGMGYVLRG
ncbi:MULTISPECIES: response regulator transcription factor [unclassified Spirosoma]|uniref:response regulator transcription factor n=1 Tax=unclassified Spirosoma TaxID=2621999 RepID=UPI000963ACF8|nr:MULTISPECIES: response regulator transcription factor [unclassified Spirosoma]MBN8823189.1 response regulator transcription factor [Spirosoma sp.]OJW72660.1 MAG: DNA-binding response regulator [Spirosoma sp. 48-14]